MLLAKPDLAHRRCLS